MPTRSFCILNIYRCSAGCCKPTGGVQHPAVGLAGSRSLRGSALPLRCLSQGLRCPRVTELGVQLGVQLGGRVFVGGLLKVGRRTASPSAGRPAEARSPSACC